MSETPPQFVMINNFVIDVSIREDHVFDAEVTDYPTESGTSFSDNIRPTPIQVTMEGIVSNTPLIDIELKRNQGPYLTSEVAVAQAYEVLLSLWNSREPVTIRTSLGTFERMALTSLSMPRTKDTGDALHFTAVFQQIQVVTNKRIRQRSGRRNLGPKASKKLASRTVIWNKGFTPGKRPIKETRFIYLMPTDKSGKRHRWYYADLKTPLSPQDVKDFELDYARDQREELAVQAGMMAGFSETEMREAFREGVDFIRQPGKVAPPKDVAGVYKNPILSQQDKVKWNGRMQ